MDVPKDHMIALLDHGLYNSAQLLGHFLVSSPSVNAETNPNVKAENLVLLGDALFREREYKRAISTYKQALQLLKIIPKQNTSILRSSLTTTNRSSSPSSANISAINENEVKFKIASCHAALNENKAAILEVLAYSYYLKILLMWCNVNKGFPVGVGEVSALPKWTCKSRIGKTCKSNGVALWSNGTAAGSLPPPPRYEAWEAHKFFGICGVLLG